jgi:hypothetical protein
LTARAVECSEEEAMKTGVLARLKRLETVRTVEDSIRPLKIEFAHLKLLSRDYQGPRHIVSVSQRPGGRYDYEERPGAPPPYQAESQDPNVMRVYLVRAQEADDEIENGASGD